MLKMLWQLLINHSPLKSAIIWLVFRMRSLNKKFFLLQKEKILEYYGSKTLELGQILFAKLH